MKNSALRIGLISDTHGLLRPQAIEALRGSDFIVHAGDIGDPQILDQLAAIAPLTAVRGNNDIDPAYAKIPETAMLQAGALRIYVLHNRADLDVTAADFQIIVSGHSHKPLCEPCDGLVYVNPGSAGPRRFKLPISVGRLSIDGGNVEVELLELTEST